MSRDVFLCDAEENGVPVELVELWLEKRDGERTGERRDAFAQRRTMPTSHSNS